MIVAQKASANPVSTEDELFGGITLLVGGSCRSRRVALDELHFPRKEPAHVRAVSGHERRIIFGRRTGLRYLMPILPLAGIRK
jgi:hypothetical protein